MNRGVMGRWASEEQDEEPSEEQLSALDQRRALGFDNTCWSHAHFRVDYPSLSKETVVAGTYLRVMLDEAVDKVQMLVLKTYAATRFPQSRTFHDFFEQKYSGLQFFFLQSRLAVSTVNRVPKFDTGWCTQFLEDSEAV